MPTNQNSKKVSFHFMHSFVINKVRMHFIKNIHIYCCTWTHAKTDAEKFVTLFFWPARTQSLLIYEVKR